MAFDYTLWMSPLACQAALPLPLLPPPPACCLKLCCLVGVRQSGVQLLLLKLVATLATQTQRQSVYSGCPKVYGQKHYAEGSVVEIVSLQSQQRQRQPN